MTGNTVPGPMLPICAQKVNAGPVTANLRGLDFSEGVEVSASTRSAHPMKHYREFSRGGICALGVPLIRVRAVRVSSAVFMPSCQSITRFRR